MERGMRRGEIWMEREERIDMDGEGIGERRDIWMGRGG
jgi:hypothetical protein